MDPTLSSSTASRPSGIPRLSRLPVPKPAQSSASSQQSVRPKPSVDSLHKRPSRSNLSTARSLQPIATPRRNVSGSTTTTSTKRDEHVFKKPVSRAPSRQPRPLRAPTPTSVATDADGGEDQLGDLDGFRASSRQGDREAEADYAHDEPDGVAKPPAPKERKSRPSLSDRTVESLSHVPPSPAGRRRRSSFFTPESPMRPPVSRPSSSMSNARRPGTSDGTARKAPHLRPTTPSEGPNGAYGTPAKRSVSASVPSSAPPAAQRTVGDKPTIRPHTLRQPAPRQSFTKSKTVASRSAKPRPSLGGLFSEPTPSSTPTPKTRGLPSQADKHSEQPRKVSSSSAALREQIAKAKASRKAVSAKKPVDAGQNADSLDFDLPVDPFNHAPKLGAGVLRKRIDSARSEGRLNISAMGLTEIPSEVMNMYEFDLSASTIAWNEAVDLTRFVAADNDLETISDDVFPNVDPSLLHMNDDAKGPQFGGIELLDLHGNLLRSIPLGLRWLTQLTTLNLSRNRLGTGSFEIVSQMPSLKDLKLAENTLDGALPDSVGELTNLEVLELQGNKLSALPGTVWELTRLRVLNVAGNKLKELPFEALCEMPIVEVHASGNLISGTLIPELVSELPRLQVLDVANNAIVALTASESIALESLRSINISANRMSSLPDVTSWTSLLTLLAEDNSISTLPPGFTSLRSLKHADFTGNNFTKLDEQIALMENLNVIRFASNPLRERKFLTMNTEDLKRDLLARMAPPNHGDADGEDGVADAVLGRDSSASGPAGWTLKPSGMLDLSSKGLSTLGEDDFSSFVEYNDVRQLSLRNNSFLTIPSALSIASNITSLDMSNNSIRSVGTEQINLPLLRELRLAGNKLTSFDTLITTVSAPRLHQLDVTYNRITGALPILRDAFPDLTLLFASDNAVSEISATALRGLKSADLSNNDIGALPAEVGLLGDTLTMFRVEGNRFRVPQYAVLKKGTEAVLAWLRDKIPETDEGKQGANGDDFTF